MRRFHSAWLAFCIRAAISLSKVSSLEMVLPKYLNVLMFLICVPSMVMHGDWGKLSGAEADCQARHLGCFGEFVHTLPVDDFFLGGPSVRSHQQTGLQL